MVRHISFDDPSVGKGKGDYFKVTGTEKHPQRIAYIPGEIHKSRLVVSPELEAQAKSRDREVAQQAIEKLEDIKKLKESIQDGMHRPVPSVEVWTNESGEKVILYPAVDKAETFWIEDVGSVLYKPGVPDECLGKRGIENTYCIVLIEYDLDVMGNIAIYPKDQQIDLGGGHKLPFRYTLKTWSLSDPKCRAWQQHSRDNPYIFTDYRVWEDKSGKYPMTKFSPAGPAFWRRDPVVKQRIIKEARKLIPELSKRIAKDFSVEEIIEMSGGSSGKGSAGTSNTQGIEEINFAELLAQSPASENGEHALENSGHDSLEVDPSYENAVSELDSFLPQAGGEDFESILSN